MYRKSLMCIVCCVVSAIAYAQKTTNVNTFKVVDADSKKTIPNTTVIIQRAGLVITTEDDGLINIPGNLATMRDTIAFYAQNYTPLKLPLSKLAGMAQIPLDHIVFVQQKVEGSFLTKVLLNSYPDDQVGQYAGIATEDAPFNYLQIAQQFTSNTTGNRLIKVAINKGFDWMHTKFRLRIYDIDPKTGTPGADLCDKIIDIDNQKDVDAYLVQRGNWNYTVESFVIDLDLKKHNIIIPNKTFFVAIEWLRNFSNGVKVPVYNKNTRRTDTAIVFRPYIGLSPVTGLKNNIWVMQIDRKWKQYDHFAPYSTDLAIKVTVEEP